MPTGTISGGVRDPAGAALEGVKVTLSDESGGLVATTTTAPTGAYAFNRLKPRKYQLRAERKGFCPAIPVIIDLGVQHKANVDLALQPRPEPASEDAAKTRAKGQTTNTVSYYQSSSLEADEVVGAVDPAGYSSPGDSNTTARLLGGAASLRQDSAASEHQPAAQIAPSEQNIFDRGAELLSQHNVSAALKVFNSGLERFPRSANLWIGQGIALYLRGDYGQAVQSLTQATDIDPMAYRPYVFLADVSGASPRESAAVAERLRRFSELYPHDARAVFYWALSLWRAAGGAEPQKGLEGVESLLKKSISLDPSFADAHLQLGTLYASQDHYTEAIEQYHQTIALDPGSAAAHYKLGLALTRTGHHEEAEQELKLYESLRQQSGAAQPKSEKPDPLIDLVNHGASPAPQ